VSDIELIDAVAQKTGEDAREIRSARAWCRRVAQDPSATPSLVPDPTTVTLKPAPPCFPTHYAIGPIPC
jgi:hypothetical protein